MHIYLDTSQLSKIESALDITEKQAAPILKDAINKTAKQAQAMLIDRARKVYIYKKGLAKKDLVLKKATNVTLMATLSATGQGVEIYHFSANGPKAWNENVKGAPATKGHALRKTKGKFLQYYKNKSDNIKAFIAEMPSGHKTVVRRTPYWQKHTAKSNLGERYLETVLSTSVPGMIGNEEKVWEIVLPTIETMLQSEVQKAINRRLP